MRPCKQLITKFWKWKHQNIIKEILRKKKSSKLGVGGCYFPSGMVLINDKKTPLEKSVTPVHLLVNTLLYTICAYDTAQLIDISGQILIIEFSCIGRIGEFWRKSNKVLCYKFNRWRHFVKTYIDYCRVMLVWQEGRSLLIHMEAGVPMVVVLSLAKISPKWTDLLLMLPDG